MKYSCISGCMGKHGDRFLTTGYTDDITGEERVSGLAATGVVSGVEIGYDVDGCEGDPKAVNALLTKYHLTASGTAAPVTENKLFQYGSLSNANAEIRAKAIQYCKQAVDFGVAIGGGYVNLWMGQDGFDYVFQTDYTRQWTLLVEAVREVCDYNPKMKIALEFKPREPRNRSLLDNAGSTLLLAKEVNRPNVGVTIDLGHVFQAQGSAAQAVELCARNNMLYNLHVNDNYGAWDDDMILGSVRYTEYIELCYSLRKIHYDNWITVDIFPYRENPFRCAEESIRNLMQFDKLIDKIGYDRLLDCINGTDATAGLKLIREALFGN